MAKVSDEKIRARAMTCYGLSPTMSALALGPLGSERWLEGFGLWAIGVAFLGFALFLRAGCRRPKWLRKNLVESGEALDYFVVFVALLAVVVAFIPFNWVVAVVLFWAVIGLCIVWLGANGSWGQAPKSTTTRSTAGRKTRQG